MSHLIIDIKPINVPHCWYMIDRDVGIIPISNVNSDVNNNTCFTFPKGLQQIGPLFQTNGLNCWVLLPFCDQSDDKYWLVHA